jgi:hypothetical protein
MVICSEVYHFPVDLKNSTLTFIISPLVNR